VGRRAGCCLFRAGLPWPIWRAYWPAAAWRLHGPNCLDCEPPLLDRRRYDDRLPGSALGHEDSSLDLGEAASVGGYTRPPLNFDPIIADKGIFSIAVVCGTL